MHEYADKHDYGNLFKETKKDRGYKRKTRRTGGPSVPAFKDYFQQLLTVCTTTTQEGSVVSPTLFNVFLGAIVHAARKDYVDAKLGIPINAKPFWDLFERHRTHQADRNIIC